MAENKTKPTDSSVDSYIDAISSDSQREDARKLLILMSEATGEQPVMWGTSIVGFGQYHYKYVSGREGDSIKVGFSARKNAITVYCLGFYASDGENNALVKKLGKCKTGKGCLYIKSLSDVDKSVLKVMIRNAYNASPEYAV